MQFLLSTIANIKDLYFGLSQHVHQVVTLTNLILNLMLPLDLRLSQLPLFILELSLLLHLVLPECLFLLDCFSLHYALVFIAFLPLIMIMLGSLCCQLLLYAESLILE